MKLLIFDYLINSGKYVKFIPDEENSDVFPKLSIAVTEMQSYCFDVLKTFEKLAEPLGFVVTSVVPR